MNDVNADLEARFPELEYPHATLVRVSDAFVAPEYARAGFDLIRRLTSAVPQQIRFGEATVLTSPQEYSNIVMTVGGWWLLNFHIAEAEMLEEDDDDEEGVVAVHDQADAPDETNADAATPAAAHEHGHEHHHEHGHEDGGDDDGDSEMIEATFYQAGTFLLDGAIIPAETILEREDIDCYAYDFPEERIADDRFYWARLIWEPEDLASEEFVAAVASAHAFVLANFADDAPFAEFHDRDLASLAQDPALTERVIAAADFGDVVVIGGTEE